jgi:hypothetical protein
MAGILKENDNWIVVEILVLLVGSGLMLSAAFGMIVQMDENMIALESTPHLVGSGGPQR